MNNASSDTLKDAASIKDVSQLQNDLLTITRSKYGSMRRLLELEAVLVIAEALSIQIIQAIAAKPARSRQLSLILKITNSHIAGIKKRIAQVERMNAAKASKDRSNKTLVELVQALVNTGTLNQLASNASAATIISRRSLAEQRRQEQLDRRKVLAMPVIREIQEAGLPVTGTLEQREQWAKEREQQAIPGADLSKQGEEILARMQRLEHERALTDHVKVIDADVDKIGSADEWLKGI